METMEMQSLNLKFKRPNFWGGMRGNARRFAKLPQLESA